jgi:hypothetical protein
MFDIFRTDVSTMNNIINFYSKAKLPRNAFGEADPEELSSFCWNFLIFRFSLPIGSAEERNSRLLIAQMALDGYYSVLNADGSPSLLALLGAIGTAERFIVDPRIVARKCQKKLISNNILGRTFGGVGIVDVVQAFENGELKFQEKRAELERSVRGISF